MLRTRLLTATAAVALFAAGSAFAQTAQTPPAAAASAAPAPASVQNSVVDVLRANGQFTTLLGALDAAQLTETLSTQPAISIFAPTDAAFAVLPEADRARLLDPANVNELRQLLLYHVIVADVTSAQIEGAKGGVQTAATTEVQLDGTGDAIKVDSATVTTADVDAGNGSIFIIDRVLNPAESLVATGDAEAATAAADATATGTPPVDEAVEGPSPADDAVTTDDSATAEAMDADSAMDEGAVAPPATTPAAPTTAAPTMPPVTSPTTASPTVPNPTDGQVDDEDADETPTPAPVPTPQA